MKTSIYINNNKFIAGTTLKDLQSLENNNMALHSCDNPANVIANREQLAQFLQKDLKNFVFANQTHSANFYKVTNADRGRGATSIENAIEDTDALYTFEKNIVLSCFTADCVPVMFWNEADGVVGVIHSGWQGTVKEITLKLFQHLIEKEQCKAEHFHVYLGRAISQEKFEVDTDVYEKFHALGYADDYMYYKDETGKYHIDNQLTVKRQCELAGIPTENIKIDKTCTYESADGFSHRRDRKKGRHLSFVMKK